MKRTKLLALLLILALALTLCSCGIDREAGSPASPASSQAAEPADAADTLTLTDMAGREHTIALPVERIVALAAADCEIVCALGAGDKLVGRGEYCDRPEEVLSVPSVESGYEMNIEQVLALQPQVLIMPIMNQSIEQVERLDAAGICLVISDAQDIEDTYTSIDMIGRIVGKEAEASSLIESMKADFAELAEMSDDAGKTVYFEVSPLQWGLWAAGSGTFMNEVAENLGLTNIFADVEGWAAVSEEEVLARNPDYIVTVTMSSGEGDDPIEEILSRPGWDSVSAVQNKAILNLTDDSLTRPTPRLTDGARALFDFVNK